MTISRNISNEWLQKNKNSYRFSILATLRGKKKTTAFKNFWVTQLEDFLKSMVEFTSQRRKIHTVY